MVKKIKLLTSGMLIACTVITAHAEGPWSIGAAALVMPNLYKGVPGRVYPMPVIDYESDSFYLRGLNAGYYLWNDKTDKLAVTAGYSPLHFRSKDSDDRSMRALDTRKSTVMAGLSYIHYSQYGFLRTALAGDILDNSNGVIWDSAWLHHYSTGNLTITPGIGAIWSSDNQNKYYYGVSYRESSRSGLKTWTPGSSWSPYVEVSINYKLDGNWNIYGIGRYVHLSDDVTGSPMIDKKWTGILLAGIKYNY